MADKTYTEAQVKALVNATKQSCLTYRDIFYRHNTKNQQTRMDSAFRDVGTALEPFEHLIEEGQGE